MKKITFILLASVLLFSCKDSATFNKTEQSLVEEEVRKTLSDYCSDVKKNGLLAEFNYLDSTENFFWVPPGFSSALSFDSVRKILIQNAGNYTLIDNAFESLKIIPIGYESAVYTCKLRSAMTDISGKTQVFSMLETGVLVKRKAGWKLSGGQTTFLKMLDQAEGTQ